MLSAVQFSLLPISVNWRKQFHILIFSPNFFCLSVWSVNSNVFRFTFMMIPIIGPWTILSMYGMEHFWRQSAKSFCAVNNMCTLVNCVWRTDSCANIVPINKSFFHGNQGWVSSPSIHPSIHFNPIHHHNEPTLFLLSRTKKYKFINYLILMQVIRCKKCGSCSHNDCWKNKCSKCQRLEKLKKN